MYLINARQDGINGNAFSKAERVYMLSENMHLKLITESELLHEVKQKKILVLMHGFNSTIMDVLKQYLAMEDQYREFFTGRYDAVIGYVWPGGESEFNYFQAKRNAARAGRRFQHWMQRFNAAQCTIDVMGHSMASIVGYHSLHGESALSIRNIFSFGAAIPKDSLKEEVDLPVLMDQVQNFYVFYTKNDHILKYWFPLVEWREAVGYSGLDNWENITESVDKISLVDCSEVVSHHTGYRSSKVLFEFIGKLLSGQKFSREYKLQSDPGNRFDNILNNGSAALMPAGEKARILT